MLHACRLYPPHLGRLWRMRKSFVQVLLAFLSDTSQPYLHRHPASAPIHPSPGGIIKQLNHSKVMPCINHINQPSEHGQ